MQGLLEAWDGVGVVVRHDRETASWIFVALHDDRLGTPVGGTRMRVYPRPEDGLRDALRLAEGMTHKWAAIQLGFGGGKAVLALSRELSDDQRGRLLDRYAALLNSLGGRFQTGEDLGTTPDDMLRLASVSPHVHGYDPKSRSMRDPGPYTALGVHAGIRAAAAARFGSPDLSGRRVVIQGVGDVGGPLAALCAAQGAALSYADPDRQRVEALIESHGGNALAPDAVYDTDCDIYAPCAIGATLNPETIPRLRCAVVAGSANNQLESAGDADRLHERGVLYAPDFVINAGGAMAFGLRATGEEDDTLARRRVVGLGGTLNEIFAEAAEQDESPRHTALRRVERVLARARDQ